MAAEPGKKPFPAAIVGVLAAVIVLGGGGAAWYFLRSTPTAQAPPPRPVTQPPAGRPAPAAQAAAVQPQPAPAPAATSPAPATTPAPAKAKKAPVQKPAAAPAPAPRASAANPNADQITKLQTLARDAYTKGNYAEPPTASAIGYAKQVLALDASNDYAKSLLENAVNGGKYQVQQAIQRKDFPTAHRAADAMTQLLPNRADVQGLKEDIASAEKADAEARKPKAPVAAVSFKAYHMHSEKAPADNGPYCLGTLSVVTGQLKFAGESASPGQKTDTLDVACSDVKEIKKNARVASKQNGFHVRTSSTNFNFVPEDSSAAHITALASACGQ